MKVKVVPVRPIPGILPKNKWIDSEIELDLNKNEIVHCMQFGNVYDEDGNIIDAISIHKKKYVKPKVTIIKSNEVEPAMVKEVPEVALTELTVTENAEPMVIEVESEPVIDPILTYVEEVVEDEIKEEVFFTLEEVSCVKEEDYIILETQLKTNSKLEGNLYGLFSVTSGPKPTFEFNVNDEWFKFSNKFANFDSMEDGAKLVFRFLPKNENVFSYRILIKEANEVLVKLEGKVNPTSL